MKNIKALTILCLVLCFPIIGFPQIQIELKNGNYIGKSSFTVDFEAVKDCTMKIKILGKREYIIDIKLKDFTKETDKSCGLT